MALDFKSGNSKVSELNKRVSALKDEVNDLKTELRVLREGVQQDMATVIDQVKVLSARTSSTRR
tara:strand:+ start:457 stop:648 length:192 start_codon:yes stop_codon:yes gene_type:complete